MPAKNIICYRATTCDRSSRATIPPSPWPGDSRTTRQRSPRRRVPGKSLEHPDHQRDWGFGAGNPSARQCARSDWQHRDIERQLSCYEVLLQLHLWPGPPTVLTAGGPGQRDASWTWHLSSPEASLTRSLALPGLTSLPVVQGHLKKYLSIAI